MWQLGTNELVPHSPLASHTSPGYATSQFHATSRLVGEGHRSGRTSRRQMPQEDPASHTPQAGADGGSEVVTTSAQKTDISDPSKSNQQLFTKAARVNRVCIL